MPTTKITTPFVVTRLAASCVLAAGSAFAVGSLPPAAAQEPTALDLAVAIEQVLGDVIQRNEKSIVAIARVRRSDPAEVRRRPPLDPFRRPIESTPAPREPEDPEFVPNEFGTGVIFDAKGLILTCYHLLREGSDYYVTTVDHTTHKARIKAADPRSDLAVLEIDAEGLTPVRFGDASRLRKGQIVISLGNPYGIARDGQASAGWGIVSNLSRQAGPVEGRNDQVDRPTLHHFGTLIHTDAKLNLGTSGGALINLKGEMIGLTTAQAAIVGFEQSAGYAIPIDAVFLRVIESLKKGHEVEYGFLGVQPENLRRDERLDGRRGARVVRVVRGTPAAGRLRPGDVITHIDGVAIDNRAELMLDVGKRAVGEPVRLTVERQSTGRTQVVQVAVELTKGKVFGKQIHEVPKPTWRGAKFEYPTAASDVVIQGSFGLDYPDEGCVVAIEIETDSPAWKGGLRPGMLVSHVGNTSVRTPRAFHTAVADSSGPVKLRLISPPGDEPVLTIEPE